jgi:hypothetical protein
LLERQKKNMNMTFRITLLSTTDRLCSNGNSMKNNSNRVGNRLKVRVIKDFITDSQSRMSKSMGVFGKWLYCEIFV